MGAPVWFVFEDVDGVGEVVARDLGGCYVGACGGEGGDYWVGGFEVEEGWGWEVVGVGVESFWLCCCAWDVSWGEGCLFVC